MYCRTTDIESKQG